MKKILTITATVLITSGVFYSCGLLKSLNEVEQNGFICSNYTDKPVNEMDKQVVLSMIRNYYQYQYNAINSSCPPTNGSKLVHFPPQVNEDSRVVFFDLDTLKRLIYHIEKASKQFPQADRQNLGVNIYFASYPETMNMTNWGWSYTNRHTLVMIPAIFNNSTHMGRDFDLNNSLKLNNIFSPLYIDSAFINDPSKTVFNAMVFKTSDAGSGSTNMNSQNHGTATPPPPSPTGNAILDLTDPH